MPGAMPWSKSVRRAISNRSQRPMFRTSNRQDCCRNARWRAGTTSRARRWRTEHSLPHAITTPTWLTVSEFFVSPRGTMRMEIGRYLLDIVWRGSLSEAVTNGYQKTQKNKKPNNKRVLGQKQNPKKNNKKKTWKPIVR